MAKTSNKMCFSFSRQYNINFRNIGFAQFSIYFILEKLKIDLFIFQTVYVILCAKLTLKSAFEFFLLPIFVKLNTF